MTPAIGMIFSVCDGDEKHFDRFEGEIDRLGFPFAVNFDHCSQRTTARFSQHPRFMGGYVNCDPESFFDESHRQRALDVLLYRGMDWMLQLDVDETLERDAIKKIRELAIKGIKGQRADIYTFSVLDLWGDGSHYRVDGPFDVSKREKLFNLKSDPKIHYYHPTVHAPKICPEGREPIILKSDCRVLHWGIMNEEEAEFHCQRWDEIYTRKVGGNPYGLYRYLREKHPPKLIPVPEGVIP